MSQLPFAVDIANARALSEEAHAAGLMGQRVRVCLQSLDILLRQHNSDPAFEFDLPGDDIVDEVAERWPELAALSAIGPNSGSTIIEQIDRRKNQMTLVQRHLLPLANQEHERAHRLSHLQENQQRALAEPQWAQEAARLRKIGVERDAIAVKLSECQQRAAQVRPLQVATSAYLERIEHEMSLDEEQSPNRDFRIEALAQDALASLDSLLSMSELKLAPLPSPDSAPQEIIQALTNLNYALTTQLGELQDAANSDQEAFTILTNKLLEELG